MCLIPTFRTLLKICTKQTLNLMSAAKVYRWAVTYALVNTASMQLALLGVFTVSITDTFWSFWGQWTKLNCGWHSPRKPSFCAACVDIDWKILRLCSTRTSSWCNPALLQKDSMHFSPSSGYLFPTLKLTPVKKIVPFNPDLLRFDS